MEKIQILIVEDEILIAENMRQTLQGWGYAVPFITSSGEVAIQKVAELRPDLVLMDIMLQGEIDGIETAAQIRAAFDVPVIFVTSYANDELLERAAATQPFGYILKPFDERELHSNIQMALHRHKMEIKLKASESRFRDLFENSGTGIIILDKLGQYQLVNKQAARVLGREPEEIVGKSLFDLFPEENAQAYLESNRRIIEAGVGREYESTLSLPAGTRTFYIVERPIQDADGEGVALQSSSIDITARVQAEQGQRDALAEAMQATRALQEERDRAQQYLDIAGVMIVVIDAHQATTLVNKRSCEILGYAENEIVGKNWFDHFIPEQDRERVKASFEMLMAGEIEPVKFFENTVLTKSGEERIIAWRNAVLTDRTGAIVGTLSSGEDITERLQAEQALRESEQRYRTLFERSSDAIFVVDVNTGRYLDANAAAERLVGRSVSELKSLTTRDVTPERATERLERALNVEESVVFDPVHFHRPDGTFSTALVNVVRIDDDTIFGIAHDITERVQAEETLKQRNRELTTLYEAVAAISSDLDRQTVLQTIVEQMIRALDASGCTLSLWHRAQGVIDVLADHSTVSPHFSDPPGTTYSLDDYPASLQVLETGHPLVIHHDDPSADPAELAVMEQYGAKTLFLLPLTARDRVLGLVELFDQRKTRRFTPREILLTQSLATQAAIALENVRLYEHAQREIAERARAERILGQRAAQLALLNDIGGQVAAVLELEALLHRAARLVQTSFGYHHVALFTLDRERDELVQRTSAGLFTHLFPAEHRLRLGQGMVGWAARHGERLLANDVNADPHYVNLYPEMITTQSELSVPIRIGGEVVGVIDIQSPELAAFDENDARVIEILADQIAVAMENARLHQESQRRAADLARSNALIAALSHVATRVETTRDPEQVLSTLGTELKRLNINCFVTMLDPDDHALVLQYVSFESSVLTTIEILVGFKVRGLRIPRERFAAFKHVIEQGQVLYVPDASELVMPLLPSRSKWVIDRILRTAGVSNTPAIEIPLRTEDLVVGILGIWGQDLREADVPAISVFAGQVGAAIENAQLVEGLEEKVAARTAEIRAEQEKSAAILHSVGDAIFMADLDGRLQYINSAFTTLTGYTVQETIGQPAELLNGQGVLGQDWNAIRTMSSTVRVWQTENTLQRKDGRSFDAAMTIAPLFDDEGQPVGYVCSIRDTSRLKELDRARNRFIASISHQLRTPLSNLKLYTRLLGRGAPADKTERYVQVLEGQVDQLSELVQDIVEMSALDSGQAVANWKTLSLPAIVEYALAACQSQAEAASLTLSAAPPPANLPPVKGDQTRLVQALKELVENAITFTPPDGRVTIQAATEKSNGDRWVTIAVRDTGPGISVAEQEAVFDRFFRGSLAESGHVPGTGLGLSIAQEIIHAHGGRITLQSEESHGSTFTIWLRPAS